MTDATAGEANPDLCEHAVMSTVLLATDGSDLATAAMTRGVGLLGDTGA